MKVLNYENIEVDPLFDLWFLSSDNWKICNEKPREVRVQYTTLNAKNESLCQDEYLYRCP